jgi:uridine monophosphate synthetase
LFPKALRQAAAAYGTLLDKMNFDLLAATPLAGLPIGAAIGLEMNVPLIYARPLAGEPEPGRARVDG